MSTDCGNCPLRRDGRRFPSLTSAQVAFMRRIKAGELHVDPGTQLLMQGSNSPQLFTVLSGMGVREKTLQTGDRQVINFVLPGDFIGLQAGVMGEMQHSVATTTDMTLCVFNRTDLWTMFTSEPELAFNVTWMAAAEEHFLGEALSVVGQLPADRRIAWGLRRFYDRAEDVGLARDGWTRFPFRQQDLADALGLSLVHTNKTLQRLRERQILSVQNGDLHIMDFGAIDEMVEVDMTRATEERPLI